jgi:hypothetical protein
MTLQLVNVGTAAGDGTGDKGQVPFNKTNQNDTELYNAAFFVGTDSGAANAYVVTLASLKPNPLVFPSSLGTSLRFTPAHANTGAATLNGAALLNGSGTALTGGELQTSAPVVVELTGAGWQILVPNSTALLAPYLNLLPIAVEAGVSVLSKQYPIGDAARYSTNFGAGQDDSAAWQAMFNVGAAGWGELSAAGASLINTPAGVIVPRGGNWILYAPGCVVTRGALCTGPAFTLNTGGNSAGVTLEGLIGMDAVFNNQPWLLGSFAINTSVLECAFLNIYQPILMDDGTLGNDGTGSIQSNFERNIFYNAAGAYGIVLRGGANATNIRSNSFLNTNTAGVLLTNDTGFLTVPDSVLIDGNWFQGSGAMTAGVAVQHATAAGSYGIYGLECTGNRFEFMTYCYAFNGVPANDSNLPPMIRGTKYTNATYLSNPAGITINQFDFGLTPLSQPILSSYAGHTFKSVNGSLNANINAVGQGIVLQNLAGSTQYFQALLKAGGGGLVDLPSGGAYQIAGTQVMGPRITGYGTPTGGANQGSFAASTITLAQLAACVAQMINDIKTLGPFGT